MNKAETCTRLAQINVGDALPERQFKPDNVQSMLYNAVLWNGHRIHYDRDYAVQEEFYPALVVHGPLLVTLLLELQRTSLPTETLSRFSFRAVRPTFDTHPFQVQGRREQQKLSLWSVDQDNAVCMKLDAELA